MLPQCASPVRHLLDAAQSGAGEQETHLQRFPELETLEGCRGGGAGRRYLVVESPVQGIAEPSVSAVEVLWALLTWVLQHAGTHQVHFEMETTCGTGVLKPRQGFEAMMTAWRQRCSHAI